MANITKETVEAVNKYARKYPNMTQEEIARLVGTSSSSVSNIMNGMYNHLLEDTKKEADDKSLKSQIPYEAYKRLVTCELAIDELINSAIKSNSGEVMLFLSAKYVDGLLKRYFPEEHEAKMIELFGEDY